ncbi:MAG: hypothetical protein KDJ35_06995 [Alphaproteobacteria bacterium]|nr:hypothetical protein [Alphaproteobacteria bacterium]
MTNHTTFIEDETRVALPLPPKDALNSAADMDVYARFMRHLRHVPNSREEIKILSAIQFTADMMDYTDAVVARILVDLGLRAPRMAFPAAFLKFADQSLMRERHDVGGPTKALLELRQHWTAIGESPFSSIMGEYSLIRDSVYI